MGAAVDRVYIRDERVAFSERIHGCRLGGKAVFPRLLAHEFVLCGMQPHDGAELAKLNPADIQLVISCAELVPADVMAPPCIPDIGGIGGKVRLKVKALPADYGIAGKSERIAVRADLGKAGKNEGSFAGGGKVERMIVVERPERVKPLDFCVLLLLPIDPPEIHTFFFVGTVENVEVGIHKFRVGNVKRDAFFALWVNPHKAGKILVLILKRAYTLRRVEVDGDLKVIIMQPREQRFVVREKLCIPAVAGPALTLKCLCKISVWQDSIAAEERIFFSEALDNVYPVPVHVNGCHRDGNIPLQEFFHQVDVFLLAVGLVSAPPVAKAEPRDEGDCTAQLEKVLQAAAVIIAEGKIILVLLNMSARFHGSVRADDHRF